ncbi:MAG: type II toxin-antitoxin system VapC family toxin [Spirochaetaceae bacterium]|nr:MAG: type II toxin-antitoxin system VapC family toxin [Spirochaetaceae bacterium]
MNYLLDTNVLSELSKPSPDTRVETWFDRVPEESLYVSVVTLGEIQSGIERRAEGAKRNSLLLWFGELQEAFLGNILPFDTDTALLWGRTRRLPLMDGLIAATALRHSMVLVTRNRPDFAPVGVDVFDPWE